jgi:hypothetical protein
MSAEGRDIVSKAHSYYMQVLLKMVTEIAGSPEKVTLRLCSLLALLPSFEVIISNSNSNL